MVRAIDAFWLTQNTLPPDPLAKSFRERSSHPVNSQAASPTGNRLLNTAAPCNGNGNGQIARQLSGSPLHPVRTQNGPVGAGQGSSLTNRQERVLQLIAKGYSSKEIASKISLSLKTIEKEQQALMDKLDIYDTASLTRFAVSNGLVEGHPGPE